MILTEFARGGGGGSSSSGGGGGASVLFVIGYFPVSFVFEKSTKIWNRTVGIILGLPLAMVISVVAIFLIRGYGLITMVGAITGLFAGNFGLNGKINRLAKRARADLSQASAKDSAWNETEIKKYVTDIFYQFQTDWSKFDVASMKKYMDDKYYRHMHLLMYALHKMGRQNLVNKPKLISLDIVNVDDRDTNNHDNFTVAVKAQANDQLVDMNSSKIIYTDNSEFIEFWVFERENNQWLLKAIRQDTESVDGLTVLLRDFAVKNGLFYNADFGWLFLPQRGQLFSEAKFKISDVNNHIIGIYNNQLIELYSYNPKPKNDRGKYYTIAQAILPKTYGNIVVRRKKGFMTNDLFGARIKGLNKITLEGNEFGGKYEVFADDIEQVTSFELLHPAFMVRLIDLPYEINIEVFDNILYLYTEDKTTSYDSMLDLMKRAFKELEL